MQSPDYALSTENLERKLLATFDPTDITAAREMLAELDDMPVAATEGDVEGLRRQGKLDAIRLSKGNLARLREAVDLGHKDFRDLAQAARTPNRSRLLTPPNPIPPRTPWRERMSIVKEHTDSVPQTLLDEADRKDHEEYLAWLLA